MKIISNTAISLDGRIAVAANQLPFLGSGADKKRLLEIRDLADAVLMGGNTFRHWPHPRVSWTAERDPLLNVVLTNSGEISFDQEFLDEPRILPLVLTTQRRFSAPGPVETIFCSGELSPEWIVTTLKSRDVSTLLLEGGGNIIHQFLAAGLLHEMYVTLCSKIIGDVAAPSLADGPAFTGSPVRDLELISQQIIGDEIFLHYRVL